MAGLSLKGSSLGGLQTTPRSDWPKPYKGVLPAFGPTQWVPQLEQEVEVNCSPPLSGTVAKVDLQRRLAWVWNDVEGECHYGFDELRSARKKRQ